MTAVKFSCTTFKGSPKKGILKPDSNGYFDLPVGGLNVLNSAGQWYDYNGARELFEESSQLMRRVKRGALRGEVGHPQPLPGQSEDDYLLRILTIDERNVCAHFSELYLDTQNFKGEDSSPIIAIMAKVTPSGPFGPMLEKKLNNSQENVCFSIRAFTSDSYVKGRYTRVLKNVVTFDYVNEPGIHIAEKFKSPAIESINEKMITKNQLQRAVLSNSAGIAKESFLLTADELFTSLGWSLESNSKPLFSKW